MLSDKDAYNIAKIYEQIENELIADMMKNLSRHRAEETKEGYDWEQWQVLQLQALEEYKRKNLAKYKPKSLAVRVRQAITKANEVGGADAEKKILNMIKRGADIKRQGSDNFFRINEARVNALIDAVNNDLGKAEYALLRQANDEYRKIIYKTQLQASTGAITYEKAVDNATKDFLTAGIQCVQYRNGARHQISSYAEMAIRTSMKRAYMQGEGTKRQEWGVHTVIVNHRNHACSKCLPFVGKVLVDDVYSGGTALEAMQMKVPLLSSAMDAGLFHPNCKDGLSTYFDGISDKPQPVTGQEKAYAEAYEDVETDANVAERKIQAFERLAQYALDPADQRMYKARANEWRERKENLGTEMKEITKAENETKPLTDAEKEALEWYVSGDGMWINQYLRGRGDFGQLSSTEEMLLESLTTATNKPLEPYDKLFRSVDARAIFGNLSEDDLYNLQRHLMYGDKAYDKGAYSQSIKQKMEAILNRTVGKEITEKGFMSTTASKEVAEMFGDFTGADNPVVIEFDTKGKKLKGVNLDFLDMEDNPQVERLLARDTKYKVNSITVETDANGGRYIKINAEILGQGEEVAKAVAETIEEQTTQTEKPAFREFIPAKTKKEAEEFAKNFADDINLGGVSLENINKINEQLNTLTQKYPINKLEHIETGGRGIMSANYRGLNIQGKKLGKTLNDEELNYKLSKAMAEATIRQWENKYAGAKMPPHVVKIIEQQRRKTLYDRWGVQSKYEDHVKAVVTHEYGHILSDQYFGMINGERANPNISLNWSIKGMNDRWKEVYNKALESGDIFKISEYASKNVREFFAECFAMREMGDTLPDYIETLMKEVLDNGIMQ